MQSFRVGGLYNNKIKSMVHECPLRMSNCHLFVEACLGLSIYWYAKFRYPYTNDGLNIWPVCRERGSLSLANIRTKNPTRYGMYSTEHK